MTDAKRTPPSVRAAAYRLLGDFMLEGPTDAWWGMVAQSPPFEEHFKSRQDRAEVAAEHFRLFGMEVLPYASVYLTKEGFVGGEVSDQVRIWFSHARCPLPTSGEPVDHLGHLLRLLRHVTDSELDGLAKEILEDGLVWWVPYLVTLGREHATPLWKTTLALIGDAVSDHAVELGVHPTSAPFDLGKEVGVPVPDSGASLRDLARYLATPVRSGLVLTPFSIRDIARRTNVPTGFGSREDLLLSLLRAAVDYDMLRAVTDMMRARALRYSDELSESMTEQVAQPWLARLSVTVDTLERIGAVGATL